MQVQTEQKEVSPFEIVYNARSNKASRSRKTSISINDKDKVKGKIKKARKMTLNPESVNYEQIKEIEENHQRYAVRSLKEQKMEEDVQEFDFTKFLELGPKKFHNEKALQLEHGISYGIGNQKDLDVDFNWNWTKQPTGLEMADASQQK